MSCKALVTRVRRITNIGKLQSFVKVCVESADRGVGWDNPLRCEFARSSLDSMLCRMSSEAAVNERLFATELVPKLTEHVLHVTSQVLTAAGGPAEVLAAAHEALADL